LAHFTGGRKLELLVVVVVPAVDTIVLERGLMGACVNGN